MIIFRTLLKSVLFVIGFLLANVSICVKMFMWIGIICVPLGFVILCTGNKKGLDGIIIGSIMAIAFYVSDKILTFLGDTVGEFVWQRFLDVPILSEKQREKLLSFSVIVIGLLSMLMLLSSVVYCFSRLTRNL